MCGIAGKLYFKNTKRVIYSEIKQMTDCLAHRGPDDEGIWTEGPIGLGHKRLAIIDLSSSGKQPMSSGDGRFFIVFNGEIYNFLELRKELITSGIKLKTQTDTEVLLELYTKYGHAVLEKLRGMFAFAIWDRDKHELFLARDRVGEKPLKYYLDKNVFIFASEAKAILQNPEVKKKPDWSAIHEYLSFQYVPGRKTGFGGIYKLEPGHYMIVKDDGSNQIKRYWQLKYLPKQKKSEEEWRQVTLKTLEEAVKLQMVSDVPLGVHLSGGIDSGMITALMAKNSAKPIKTFTVGFKEQDYNEMAFARLTAQKYNTEHHEIIVEPNVVEALPKMAWHYEEPYGDSSALATWRLMETTKKYMTVALNGDGGDENFGGYIRYTAFSLHPWLKTLPLKNIWAKSQILANTPLGVLSKRYSSNPKNFYFNLVSYFGPQDQFRLFGQQNQPSETYKLAINEAWELDGVDKLMSLDFHTYLPNDLLPKVDLASMAFGVEARSPFLDYRLLELTAAMPVNLKVKRLQTKWLLKKIAADFLPKRVLNKPKTGFAIPLKHWFKKELYNYAQEILLDKSFLDYGFSKPYIEKLLKEHTNHINNHSGKLWLLLSLNAWFKAYFK